MPSHSESDQNAGPLDGLQKIETAAGSGNTVIFVGKRSGWTSLFVTWFPVIAALCYGFVVPFVFTAWGETNLVLILAVWLCGWVLLVAVTLLGGTGRHLYAVDFERREIGHLNSGENVPLAVTLRQGSDGAELKLAQPLASGWHLNASERALAELRWEDAESIPPWRPIPLKAHLETRWKDGNLLVLLIVVGVPMFVMHLASETLGYFAISLGFVLVAWLLGQTVSWLLDCRDFRLLSGATA